MNNFLKSASKKDTVTQNGAVAHSSTGNVLADQFATAASQRGRDFAQVFVDQSQLHNNDAESALRFAFYLRMITRKPKNAEGVTTVQRGQGNRDEAFKRLLWYASNHPKLFYENIWLLGVVGSTKDIWDLMVMASINDMELDQTKMFETYKLFLQNGTYTEDLAKKYLPTIKSSNTKATERSQLRTKLGQAFRKYLKMTPKEYRHFKSSGTAHEWQQMISKGDFNLKFNSISGRALSQLVSSKFLKNKNLTDKYLAWIQTQPVAKFTGYVYELGKKVKPVLNSAVKHTLDKQFDGLIELAKQDTGGISGNVWCALDTSASMSWASDRHDNIDGNGTSCLDVCLALGVYFATLNTGAFHKNVIGFSTISRKLQLSGNFTDMMLQAKNTFSSGSTNFLSVIDEIVRVRKQHPSVALEDFPETLLVVSDMQFNPVGSVNTNHEEAKKRLSREFPKEWVDKFKVIWWDCTPKGPSSMNFPSNIDEGGTYVFSGFDGSVVTLLTGANAVATKTGAQPTMMEMIQTALDQDVLKLVQA